MFKIELWGKEYANHYVATKQRFVIFDLDGTLSNGINRLHLLPTVDLHLTESWSEFNRAAKDDLPFMDNIAVCNAMFDAGYLVIILTGRSDEVEAETRAWLAENGVSFDWLIMRRAEDNRKDTVIKEEVLRTIGLDRIVACWDDSPNVIAHLRGMGLTVYQVIDYGEQLHDHLKSHGVEELSDDSKAN
ncbi:hypothetical protein MBBL140_11 [Streptococcus phage MBBL140]|nr:hypothetical protein MBBL140_11 [Streptococcus phage MBBL140]